MRTDLTFAQQLVQSNHATFEMASHLSSESNTSESNTNEVPYCVVIGVPDKHALFRVVERLKTHDINHHVFYEPDDNMGLSAVATMPLFQEQRRVLSNYRLWGAE